MPPVLTPPDLRALTTLRFVAAFWVVMHAAWPHLDIGFVPNLVAKGYLGVEVFFVLSGFILSHVYLEAFGTGRFRYGGFLWARFARVYPLHLATLIGVIVLALVASAAGIAVDAGLTDWRSLPAHLTLTQAWGLAPGSAFNHPSWSVSAEAFAYLSFPAAALLAWRLRSRPFVATAGAAILALIIYAAFEPLVGHALTKATFLWGALRIVPCFILGCAVYLIHRRAPVSPWVAVVGAVGLLANAALGGWDPVTVLFATAMILGLAGVSNARAGWVGSRLGVYLGEVSYSVYMVSAPVLLVMTNVAARVLGAGDDRLHAIVWVIAVAAILPTAMVLHHTVERPARRLLRGLPTSFKQPGPTKSEEFRSPERGLQHSETIV